MMQRNFFLQSLEITMHLKPTYLEYTPLICSNNLRFHMLQLIVYAQRVSNYFKNCESTSVLLHTFNLRVQLYAWNNVLMTNDIPNTSKAYGFVSIESHTLLARQSALLFFFVYLSFLLRTFTNHRNFDLLHRHLDIRRTITAESSYLHVGSDQTPTRNSQFPSASH